MIPAIIKYVPTLENKGGTSIGPYVKIAEKHRGDKGLLAHELRHVLHWWVAALALVVVAFWIDSFPLLGVAPLAYNAAMRIRFVRLWAEVDCYRAQLKHYDNKDYYTLALAEILASERYNLGITVLDAMELLDERD